MRCSSIWFKSIAGFALLFAVSGVTAHAEDGSAAWLRYAPIAKPVMYKSLPGAIWLEDRSDASKAAANELRRGLSSMLGRAFVVVTPDQEVELSRKFHGAIYIGSAVDRAKGGAPMGNQLTSDEGYDIEWNETEGRNELHIEGGSNSAELYGAFHLLEEVAAQQPIPKSYRSAPSAPIRWTDEWDNLNGTIERGYAGSSIFFENGHVRQDLARAGEYARLLASVGINGCNVNNVNADLDLLTTEHIKEFARIADVFRPWGVKLALSVDLTSPQTVDEIYKLIPDFGGFTVKADSEGRKGPSQYGRTPADAANLLARAVAPHHGVVLYRGFVYNNHLDWHDLKADRARAGVDNFASLDGKFEKNVIIQ